MAKRIKSDSTSRLENTQKKVILASLKLARSKNWNEISLEEIAQSAKLSLLEVHQLFRSKNAILKAFNQQLDAEVIANAATVSTNGTIRDQLFELLMLRFDLLSREKESIKRIICYTISRNPIASLIGLKDSKESMRITMEVLGISTRTPLAQLKVSGLLAIYLNTVCTWLKDDTPDLTKTMADLDKSLSRAEVFFQSLSIE